MPKTQQPLLTASITALAALTASRFVGYDGDVCGANARALGVLETDTSIGEQAPVNTHGIAIVESGAAVSVGDPVASDSVGRAVPATALSATVPGTGTTVTSSSAQPAMTMAGAVTPQGVNGVAIDAASGAGEFIRIKLNAV